MLPKLGGLLPKLGGLLGRYGMVMSHLNTYIQSKFEMLCSSLLHVTPIDVATLVAEHGKVVDELAIVKDLVEPCFPPTYHIFQLFVDGYHAELVELVRVLMDQHAASLLPSDIIQIVAWLRDYHGQLQGLGGKASPVLTDDLGALLQNYNYRIESMMRSWSERMLVEDLASPPESTRDGKLYTVAPIDLFKMMDQQFEVVDALALEKSTYALAVTVCQVLQDYRTSLSDLLVERYKHMQLEQIVAQVNNAARCVECSLVLQDQLAEKLPDVLVQNVELQHVADAFTDLSKMAGELLGKIVIQDLAPVCLHLFTAAWYSGEQLAGECICNTLWDYGQELRSGLHDSSHRKVLVYILDRLVILILAQLLSDKGPKLPINAHFVAALQEDVGELSQTLSELGLPTRMLRSHLLPIQHMCKLCAILANPDTNSDKPPPAVATPSPSASRGRADALGAGVGEAGEDDVVLAHKISLEELGLDTVVGTHIVAASAGEGSLVNAVASWYRLALQGLPV